MIIIEKRVPFPRPIVSLLGMCPLLLLHCGPPDEQQAAGTRRMAERLEEIARNADPATHAYVNARRVKYYRDRVEHLRESVAAMDPRGKVQILNARFSYASELLRAGHSEDAVKEYRELLAVKEYRELRTEADRRFRPTLQMLVGVSYLRLGEQENCILQHTIDSCLLPIRETGVHQAQRGSRAALREFLEVLSGNPRDLSARWLLNIAYMTLGEYPREVPSNYLIPPELFESDYDIGHFDDVAPALGLDVVGLAGGAVMEDFDGDGHLDIMASSSGLRDQLRYFRNGGDGTFADLTEQAGLAGIVGGLNALQADYDNNGFADVLILRGAWLGADGHYPNSLLSNLGDGRFVDVTEAAGLLAAHPTQTAAWGDYDNDGWVDLFVGNESVGEDTLACELFRNGGDADRDPVRFSDVAEEAGVAVVGYVKGVVWGDYDNDGLVDLYVSRLFADPNLLLRNEGEDAHGRWRFTDVTATAGVPGPTYSFPTWFWDYDNDGWQDIFVAGFKGDVADVAADYLGLPHNAEEPRLYRNNGDGTFADVTREAGLDEPLIAMGSNFGDLDNDGFPDCYIGTGDPYMVTIVPNRMFRNAAGRFFQDVTTSGGFGHLQKGHGVAFGDIDHDGDQDVFAVMGGAYTGDVYQNVLFRNPGHGNRWIKLRLEGRRSNRAAIGARVVVRVNTADGVREIHSTVSSGGSFGASTLQREIGLGQATSIRAIEVFWPASGDVQVFENVEMGQTLVIREGDPLPTALRFEPFEIPGMDGSGQHEHARHGPGHQD